MIINLMQFMTVTPSGRCEFHAII